MSCVVQNCREHVGGKSLMCKQHWVKLPESLRSDVRRGTEKGQHSLRARPSREWLGQATKYVGAIKNLVISVSADERVKRKFSNDAPNTKESVERAQPSATRRPR